MFTKACNGVTAKSLDILIGSFIFFLSHLLVSVSYHFQVGYSDLIYVVWNELDLNF